MTFRPSYFQPAQIIEADDHTTLRNLLTGSGRQQSSNAIQQPLNVNRRINAVKYEILSSSPF